LETVSVKIPASPEYVQVVRLIAAGLAARLGFTLDDIEDLKIAVDELTAYFTGTRGREGRLEITFSIDDDSISIRGEARFEAPGTKVRSELTQLSRQILETVADSASLQSSNGLPAFELTKRKRS
jgi:serine/threonine-protein kinase RsbW